MTPTETLRAAAVRLREVAGAATDGPWEAASLPGKSRLSKGHTVVVAGDRETPVIREEGAWFDAAYIATMHPGIGLGLAEWLEAVARDWALAEDQADPLLPDADGWMTAIEDTLDSHALAVARLILGEVATDE